MRRRTCESSGERAVERAVENSRAVEKRRWALEKRSWALEKRRKGQQSRKGERWWTSSTRKVHTCSRKVCTCSKKVHTFLGRPGTRQERDVLLDHLDNPAFLSVVVCPHLVNSHLRDPRCPWRRDELWDNVRDDIPARLSIEGRQEN